MITVLLEREILKGQLLYTGVQRSGLENNLSSSNQELRSLKVRLTTGKVQQQVLFVMVVVVFFLVLRQ